MNKLLKFLTLLLLLGSAAAQSVTVTGTVTDPSGNPASGGYVQFTISPVNASINYSIIGTSTLAPSSSRCGIQSGVLKNQALTGSCLVWGNDVINPANTLYTVSVAPNSKVTKTLNNVALTGSTQDLSSLQLVNPQPLPAGTVQANPLFTMGVQPITPNVFSIGGPNNPYSTFFINYVDFHNVTTPSNPFPGFCRLYYSITGGVMFGVNSTGGNCLAGGTGGSLLVQTNGVTNISQALLNFTDSGGLHFLNGSGGLETVTMTNISPGSLALGSGGLDTGVVNAYAACPTALPNPIIGFGLFYIFQPLHTNTSSSTFSLCSGALNAILKNGSTPLVAGDLVATKTSFILFDGTNWQLLNPATVASGSGITLQTNTVNNPTQTTLNFLNSGNIQVTSFVGGGVQHSLAPNIVLGGVMGDQYLSDTGTTNAYAACPFTPVGPGFGPTLIHLAAGTTNTATGTFNLCANGAVTIAKKGATALIAGDIVAGMTAELYYDNTRWQLLNPASIGSGTFSGQQAGQPTVGLTAGTATTQNATFVSSTMSGVDACAKITTALNACPASSTATCHVIVNALTPGSIDVCGTATSNFWSGVSINTEVDLQLETLLQVKRPVVFPAIGHLVHGIASNQTVRGTGFIADPTFADPANLCNFSGTNQGPFPAGHYLCLVIDGGTTATQNAFGGKWRDISLDCNNIQNCIAFYTLDEQEDSGFRNVRVWGNATPTLTNVSACGFWDHSAASSPNTGPSHFQIEDSYCDPFGDGIVGSNANNTIYGWVYEAFNSVQPSGGNIRIHGGTVRASGTNNLMQDAVWIHNSNLANVEDIHAEWLAADGVEFHGCVACKASNISTANHASVGVHFYTGSTGVAYSIQASGAEVQDDPNGCTTSGSTLEFYNTDDGGQGWWNGGFHVCGSANSDKSGNLTFAATTTQSYSFVGGYSQAPQCQATPTSNPGAVVFWTTATTSALTIHASSSFTGNVNYECTGRGN